MVANATGVVLHDAIENAGHVDDPDLDPALLEDLACDGLAGGLTELDEAAGQAPLPEGRRLAAAHEQHPVLVEDDRADADPRVVRVLAAHAGPVSQASVAYLPRASRRPSRPARRAPEGLRPAPGRSTGSCRADRARPRRCRRRRRRRCT